MADLSQLGPILEQAQEMRASDIHIITGIPPALRCDGEIILMNAPPLTRERLHELTYSLLEPFQKEALEKNLELCFSVFESQYGRFRVTVYFHAGVPELSIRRCVTTIPTRQELGLPAIVEEMVRRPTGLVLVTGPTGMGKTTTLNFMIDLINSERRCKVVTIEDPVEFVHRNKKAIIVQQEVHADTLSFSRALVHVLRQDPDVICVGEMRDLETIATALTAAETGHLVLATLHTPNALQTVERICSIFPEEQQKQIVAQLSNSIQAIIAQLLLPRVHKKGRALACEVLIANPAVRKLIRDNQIHQLVSYMQTSRKFGMQTMDMCLEELYDKGEISYDTAITYAVDANALRAKARA